MKFPHILQRINEKISEASGKAYLVGGAVRDSLLGIEPKDFDVEVYNLSLPRLSEILSVFGEVKEVGESFGVLKLTCEGEEFDFSLPRRDSKTGKGHKDFRVETSADMSVEKATSRRDFTINAILYDITKKKYVDPFNGIEHLKRQMLLHVSPAFAEDPLRVLRAMQFAGRFDLYISTPTALLCQELISEYSYLAKERVWQEWYKWASKSKFPELGLSILTYTNWISLYPEVSQIRGLAQCPQWHPEGDVYTHTQFTLAAAANIAERENLCEEDRAILVFAALCHDFGKTKTTVCKEGRIVSPEHDKAGIELSFNFLQSIGAPIKFLEAVPALVGEHMIHVGGTLTSRTVRRLAVRLGDKTTIKMLSYLIEADHSGRPPLPAKNPCPELLTLAEELQISQNKPEPYLKGRHLISLGLTPGKQFGELIKESFELQLDGKIINEKEALQWVKERIV